MNIYNYNILSNPRYSDQFYYTKLEERTDWDDNISPSDFVVRILFADKQTKFRDLQFDPEQAFKD